MSVGHWQGVGKNRHGQWVVEIRDKGQRVRIGAFNTEEEAARAYDVAAVEIYGEFAATNVALGLLP